MALSQCKYVPIAVLAIFVSACSGGNDSSTSADAASNVAAAGSSTSALTLVGQPPTTVAPGSEYYFNMNATGGDQASLAFSIANKPSWATFNTATGELKGKPSAVGTFAQIVVSVTDGVNSTSSKPFTIEVADSSVVKTTTGARLSWSAPMENVDGSSLEDLSGYAVRYGTSASALDQKITIGSAVVTSYTIGGLKAGQTYYFAVAAVTAQNVEGELSSPVSLQM